MGTQKSCSFVSNIRSERQTAIALPDLATFDNISKETALGDTECKGQYTALRKPGKRAVK